MPIVTITVAQDQVGLIQALLTSGFVGIPVSDSAVSVDCLDSQIEQVQSIATPYMPPVPERELRMQRAKGNAALVLEMKTITGDQAVAWIENNVTSLATAKTVLKIMARMIVALRDQTWPDLPDIPTEKL